MKKNNSKILYVLACLMILSSCSSSSKNSTALELSSGSYDVSSNESFERAMPSETEMSDEAYSNENPSTQNPSTQNSDSQSSESTTRKKIIDADLNIETENFNSDLNKLQSVALQNGGYVSSVKSEKKSYRGALRNYSDLELKIPVDKYESAKSEILKIGKILSMNESSFDATDEYKDINLTLELKREEETRLLSFLERAETIEDILLLEDRIAKVKSEILVYENRKLNIERLSSYSTLNIQLTEKGGEVVVVVGEETLGEQLSKALKTSIQNAYNFLESVLVGIALFSVQLVIIFIIVIFAVIRKRFKKSRKKA